MGQRTLINSGPVSGGRVRVTATSRSARTVASSARALRRRVGPGVSLYSATNVSVTSELTVTVYSLPASKSEPSGTVDSTIA